MLRGSSIALLAGLTLCHVASLAHAEQTTVGIDMSDLDEASFRRLEGDALEKGVIVRLVQEGFAVVAASQQPAVTVKYLQGETLHIVTSKGEKTLVGEVEVGEISDVRAFHLEVAHKTAELVRQLAARESSPAQSSPAQSSPAQSSPAQSSPAQSSPAQPLTEPSAAAETQRQSGATQREASANGTWSPTHELDVMGGFVMRGPLDPLIGLGFRADLSRPFALVTRLSLVPASDGAIDVLEWQAQVGVAWSLLNSERWRLSLGLEVGALVHHFGFQRESGTRLDFLGLVPLTARVMLSEHIGLAARVALGITEESREHRAAADVLWSRSNQRLETGLQLVWRL